VSKTRWLLATAGGVVGLFAVACGGDDSSSGSGGDNASATTTTAQAPAKCNGDKVRFQLSFFGNAQHVGYLVAANRGFFDDEGLSVKVIPGGPTVNPPLQLAQGNVDIAQFDFGEVLNARANGAPVKWIAQTYQQDPIRYITLKSVPLSSPADLKGKTVGSQQTGSLDPELQGMLEQAGLSKSDIKVKQIGFSIEDLMNKNIQVFPLQTFFHIAQLKDAKVDYPGGVNVLDPNENGTAIAGQGLAVNEDFYNQHKDAVTCFLRASLKGWQAAIDDPDSALADVEKFLPKGVASKADNKIDIAETIKIVTTNASGQPVHDLLSMDMSYLQDSADRLKKFGIVKQDVPLDEVVDPGPLEQARASAGS
jgi:NitT/TauT family transport system substrate-binding protein